MSLRSATWQRPQRLRRCSASQRGALPSRVRSSPLPTSHHRSRHRLQTSLHTSHPRCVRVCACVRGAWGNVCGCVWMCLRVCGCVCVWMYAISPLSLPLVAPLVPTPRVPRFHPQVLEADVNSTSCRETLHLRCLACIGLGARNQFVCACLRPYLLVSVSASNTAQFQCGPCLHTDRNTHTHTHTHTHTPHAHTHTHTQNIRTHAQGGLRCFCWASSARTCGNRQFRHCCAQ